MLRPRQPDESAQRSAVSTVFQAALLVSTLLACAQPSAGIKGAATGEEPVALTHGRSRCGHEHDDAQYAQAQQRIAKMQQIGALNRNNRLAFSSAITVPVAFHVIPKADGTGNVTLSQLTTQVSLLNNAYSPNFNFILQSVDYTTNDLWYTLAGTNKTLEYEAKTALHQGGNDTLNIYFLDPSPYLGFAYYPTILDSPDTAILDGLMIHPATLPGGDLAGYNLGGTIIHETGHWLLLSHTFQGGCTDPNDFVSDTAEQPGPTSGCPTARSLCGAQGYGADPTIHNFMDYSTDACYESFTAGQVTRIQWAWVTYRAPNSTPATRHRSRRRRS